MYGCKTNTLFTVRAMMKQNPFKFNIIILIATIVFFGQAVKICESPLSRITDEMDYSTLSNSMWAVVLTMTSGKKK